MNIVVLDGEILNPGDMSWKPLEDLGTLTVYDRTSAEDLIARAQNAQVLITNKTPLRAETLAALPNLQYIGVVATGYDVIDIEAAAARAIPVCNVVAYGVGTVAQHVMAFILELSRNISLHSDSVRNGEWTRRNDWCYWLSPLRDFGEMRMGVVGFGNIGREVGRMAHALGMQVQAYVRSPKEQPDYACDFVSLETLFATSDVISLHCPFTEETRQMINVERLTQMKSGALLINTARGALVDESAVAAALHSGHLGGFGTDVLATEPPALENPLLSAPRCLITPHIAWATRKARANILRLTAENLQAWQQGQMQHVVNKHLFV